MKIETLFLTILLTLAATRSYGQSADGGDDDAADALDASSGAPADAISPDDGGSDASSTADAGPLDAAGAKDAISGGAQDATANHLFARENPGCSLGGAPSSGGWQLLAGTFIAVAAARRRRSSRAG